jgi:hypothetical protein
MKRWIFSLGLGLAVVFGLSGCETPGQSAIAGAAAGALIGGSRGNDRDMLRGAAIGAAGGYVLGKVAESDRNRSGVWSQPQPVASRFYAASSSVSYVPYGRPAGRRGFVFSPYSRRLVDVRGIPRGAEVVDPFSGQIFRNP